jgi:hypothetical protein
MADQFRNWICTTTKRRINLHQKRTESYFIAVLNAVDDQLYFATDPSLKKWFEESTKSRFDAQLANWYLQSRITQCTDKSIILVQSRCAVLVLQKYLYGASDSEVTLKMKEKYPTPVPSTTIFTKGDYSPTYSKVIELQQEYGFEYAAVLESLIYLMNTYTPQPQHQETGPLDAIPRQNPLQLTPTSTASPTVPQTPRRNQILL